MLKVEELNKLTNKKEEAGYVQNKDSSFTKLNPIKDGHSLDLKGISFKDINGFIHTHLDDFPTGEIDKVTGMEKVNKIYRMFSPADVIAFLSIAKQSKDVSKVYGTMISSSGHYTMRFTGNQNDIVGIKSASEYRRDYIKAMRKGLEKGFLQFLKDHIKVEGIELYNIRNNGPIRSKTLDKNGKLSTEDCE